MYPMQRKPQQQTLSMRISPELRNYLERAREVFVSHHQEPVSTAEVCKLLLESAIADHLDDPWPWPTSGYAPPRRCGPSGANGSSTRICPAPNGSFWPDAYRLAVRSWPRTRNCRARNPSRKCWRPSWRCAACAWKAGVGSLLLGKSGVARRPCSLIGSDLWRCGAADRDRSCASFGSLLHPQSRYLWAAHSTWRCAMRGQRASPLSISPSAPICRHSIAWLRAVIGCGSGTQHGPPAVGTI
jgi:hypothetical protein